MRKLKLYSFPILCLCLFICSQVFLLNSCLHDLVTRASLNEQLITLFSFFWTNYWYLFVFFFFVFCWHYWNCWNNNFVFFILIAFTFYFYEFCDFLIATRQLIFLNYNKTAVNFLLLNNLNKYHPFLLYFSSWLITFVFLVSYDHILKYKTYRNGWGILLSSAVTVEALCFNFIALLLGAWWAIQEGTWGGWWNWDASEVLGLLILHQTIVSLHFSINILQTIKRLVYNLNCFLFFSSCYFFIQLNFELVSHNFGTKMLFFFDNHFFLVEVFFLSLVLMLYLSYWWLKTQRQIFLRNQLSFKFEKCNKNIFVSVIGYSTLAVIYLSSSFNLIINYFLWKYVGVTTANTSINLFETNFLVLIVFFFLLNLTITYNNLIASTLNLSVFSPIIIVFYLIKNKTAVIHNSFWIFLLLSLFSSKLQVLFTASGLDNFWLCSNFNFFLKLRETFSLDATYLELFNQFECNFFSLIGTWTSRSLTQFSTNYVTCFPTSLADLNSLTLFNNQKHFFYFTVDEVSASLLLFWASLTCSKLFVNYKYFTTIKH